MGLFDRGNSEEEVEIKPKNRRERDYGVEDDDGEERSDDSEGEFLLPGMKAASDESSSQDGSGQRRQRGSHSRGGSDGIDRVIEQNERIIELLEELVGSDAAL